MVEIASAWVAILPETSKIAPGVKSALKGVDAQAAAAGQSMGSKMSGALGKALKGGAVAAGAAAVAGIGVTMTKGFQRLSAIDEARAKLTALGSSGREVDAIMKNALASVKGTSFGLGDAAGLAGTMVAAGIKPGRELESVLKTVADSAAVAGTDLNDMGQIFGKVAAKGKLDGEALNQLMERQIGILPELAKHYGVTTEEASKMVSDGKVKFADFAQVMEKKLGGGAVKMGNTVKGAFANMNAAIGRLGASALEPFFEKLPGGFNGISDAIDKLEPKVKDLSRSLSTKIFDEWGPKVKKALEAFKASGNIEQAVAVFKDLGKSMGDAAPTIGRVIAELGRASAALGVSGWQLFLTALKASATTLNIINPLLSGLATLMEKNRGLVTAFMAAWIGMKTIPNLIGNARTALAPLASGLQTARAGASNFADAYRQSMVWVRQSNPGISTAGAHFKVLQGNVRAAGGAMGMMRGAAGGLMGLMGGPWGIALAAAGVGLSMFAKRQQDAAEKAAQHKADVDALIGSVNAYTGALTEQGRMEVHQQLRKDGAFGNAKSAGVSAASVQQAAEGNAAALSAVNAQLDQQVLSGLRAQEGWDGMVRALNSAGLAETDMLQAVRGNQAARDRVAAALPASAKAHEIYQKKLSGSAEAALKLGWALGDANAKVGEAADAMRTQDAALGLVSKRLDTLAEQFKGKGKGFSLEFDTTEIAGTEKMLEAIGFKLKNLGNGRVKVIAETDEAAKKLAAVSLAAKNVPPGKDIKVGAPGGDAVYELLKSMGVEVSTNNDKTIAAAIPEGSPVLALLREIGYEVETRNGKTVIVKADDTDYQGKKREWTETVYKQIIAQGVGFGDAVPGGGRFRGPGIAVGADGMIVPYVNGGIAAAEAFANGGLKHIPKPTSADIYAGRGAGTIFAEEETGGEAYIPLAPGKRSRSTDILATVADLFGLAVVPKDSISGMLGAIAGGAVSKLLAKAGADNLTRFADGGFSGKQLRELAEGGHGASQPLTGAPYAWSGVNWGDCSGAQSGFTRAAAGLDPFGGRWSTGSAGSDLPAMGFERGRWEPGFMGVGVKHGGPGGGHTAGTLPDGTNVEMGGSYGGGMMGGSVGANDGQFTEQWRLRVADDVADPVPSSPTDPTVPHDPSAPYDPSSPQQPVDTSTSFSQKLGNAAGSFVSGQLSSLFGVLGVNDSPGALAAWNELESQRAQNRPTDPGTTKPKEGEDTGATEDAATSAAETVQEAVKRAFAPAKWDEGAPWNATDWIVSKESGWDPKAQNPDSTAYGLFQFLNETWATVGASKTDDPYLQGVAGQKYIAQRYGDPEKAKAFWEENNWFDRGGIAQGVGAMLKNTNQPERVLSPRQTSAFEQMVKRDFQAGIGTDEVIARLDKLITILSERDGGDTYNFPDYGSAKRDADEVRRAKRQNAILAGV